MKNLIRYIGILLGLSAFGLSVQAQSGSDSSAFLQLLDSIRELKAEKKLSEGIDLSSRLLSDAEMAGNIGYVLEAHHLLADLRFKNYQDDQAKADVRTCIELAKQENEPMWLIKCSDQLALIHFNLSEYDSAETMYKLVAETARDYVPERYAVALSNMAFIYGVMNQREQELDYFLQSLAALDENPDSFKATGVRAMAYSGLGDYYAFIGDYEKAKENYENKLALGIEIKSKRIQYEAHGGLGTLYSKPDNYDFEKSRYHQEIPASEEDPTFGHYKNQSVVRLARLYKGEKLYNQALTYFEDAYAYYQTTGGADFRSGIETEIGALYLETDRRRQARTWLTRGLSSAKKKGLISRERDALRKLYKLDSMEGRFLASLSNYQRLNQITDSLSSERSRNRINELQIQYETEQTENENLALRSDLELKEAQMQRQQLLQLLIAIVAVTMIVLALVIYRNYQRKKNDHDTIARQAEKLRELSNFKQGLTSMVVHDMRNPINAIIGFSLGTPTEKKLKSINQSGHKVLNLVTNMLDIQRFEEANVVIEEEVFDWRDFINETVNEVHLLLQAKSIRIENKVPSGVMLKGDKTLVSRILINLLTNAVKFSRAGATVFMELGDNINDRLELIVRDQGNGISEEQLPFVFDKFWHTDYSKSDILPSTGLGLSFCKLAVEAHGGSIRAESIPGEGTSMIFTLLQAVPVVHREYQTQEKDRTQEEALSAEDIHTLKAFLPDLKGLQIHEVSAINKLIRDIETKGVERKWSNDLQSAVYQGDQERYNALLALAQTEELI